ncbi:MAG: NUDIX domain-containing protein [Chloroflexota bacterium]
MFDQLKILTLYLTFHLKKRFQPPPTPRPSATILLVRDGADHLEVFMVVRHRKIDFASGALVFPGGKVDPQDKLPNMRQFCDGADELSDEALSLRIAAIRETFEECGILLARADGEPQLIDAERVNRLASYRDALNKRSGSMQELVTKENLRLACDQCHHFSHWVTPEMVAKRYDTHFFLVEAPGDQVGQHDGHESVDSLWINPKAALDEAKEGKHLIVFPTRLNLEKLGENQAVSQAIDQVKHAAIHEVLPTMVWQGMDIYLTLPESAGYGKVMEPLKKLMTP